MDIHRVAVIGAGEMGHGIAELFALRGYNVNLMDKFPEAVEKAKAGITWSLAKLVERGKLTKAESDATSSRITFLGELGSAVSNSDLVIEAVPEVAELKKSVLKEVEEFAPRGAILASNTSNIRISELAEGLSRPERLVGMHFFNPPVIMKLVEVIPGRRTDAAVTEDVTRVCSKLERTPIRVLQDSPGFIVNRINAAETLFFCLVLDSGTATPEQVDAYARGQGLAMGPYERLDFVGIDIAQDMLSYFSKALSPEYGKGRAFEQKVRSQELGKKTGRGFYDWSTGKAQIPKAEPTDKVSIMDIFAIEINEAVKLIEEGVAKPEDVEQGVTLGMNRPFGPITVAKSLSNSEVKSKLEELEARFDTRVFAPAEAIVDGKMLDAIEGRLAAPAPRPTPALPAKQEGKPAERGVVYMEKLGGGLAKIVINRPRLNLLSMDVVDGLDRIISDLWQDNDVTTVVITGDGGVFSAGLDLSQFVKDQVEFIDLSRKGQRTFRRLTEFPKLTIAVIKGYALGGGLELAMSCDLRVATEDARLGFTEITLGLVPGWSGTQRATRLIGLSRASQLVLTGEKITGKSAFELGLVNRIVQSGDPDEFAIAYARTLAPTIAPVAVALAKRLLNKAAEVPSDVGLEMEAISMGILFGTADFKEGISAFLGKRKPEFKGK